MNPLDQACQLHDVVYSRTNYFRERHNAGISKAIQIRLYIKVPLIVFFNNTGTLDRRVNQEYHLGFSRNMREEEIDSIFHGDTTLL